MTDVNYQEVLTRYRALLARFPEAQEKGKKARYTSLNGHMTSFVSPQGQICLRLSSPDREAFLAAHPGPPVMQYGAEMKDYVGIPDTVSGDVAALAEWFAKSWSHVGSLMPKPTRR
ncbi:MAG: hypothetical protein GY717_09965 [Rhodobacteraceae bacterium]|nr:hypothetical protein [Paracoccaceae bacterium]